MNILLFIYWVPIPITFIYISLGPLELKIMGSKDHLSFNQATIRYSIHIKLLFFTHLMEG